MTKLTIGRMAKLYGLHRSTLYEAVAKGRVSATPDGKGQRVIDLSEMIRVYGEPTRRPTPAPDIIPPAPDSHPTPAETPAAWADLVAELRLLREEVAGLRQTLLRIEHKPDTSAVPAGTAPAAPPKAASSFADLLAGLGEG